MAGGGSGANLTMHVRFIVDPLFINRSGPPTTSVIGSANWMRERDGKRTILIMMNDEYAYDLRFYLALIRSFATYKHRSAFWIIVYKK